MSDAEREYIRKACNELQPGGSATFYSPIVRQAFPTVSPSERVSEGYVRKLSGVTTYAQFCACINYGKGVFTVRELPDDGGVYEVYRIK